MPQQQRKQERKSPPEPRPDLAASLAELEKRVARLVAENRTREKRIRQLERELADVQREATDLQSFHGQRMRIREKIERVLKDLEGMAKRE